MQSILNKPPVAPRAGVSLPIFDRTHVNYTYGGTMSPKGQGANAPQSHTVSQIAVARAEQRGITTDKAAKEVRGILRANFDVITKLDPSILEAKDTANDGVRWPSLNDDVRAFVLDRTKRADLKAKVKNGPVVTVAPATRNTQDRG